MKELGTEVILNFQPWYLRAPALTAPLTACLNLHTAALPKYRGVEPVVRAALAGERMIGVSIHSMVEEIDAGRVLAQAEVPRHNSVYACYKATFDKVPDLVDQALSAVASAAHPGPVEPGESKYFGKLTAAEIAAFRRLRLNYL